ncbi:DNA mismatch repair protein MutS [Ferruginibacter lapsinanis]|uniref:MutS-related protein n=1 Tax=Ferruginibacter lapsinanis TaxID=563172 RepID=UPI001E33DEA5|nr:DNA mismatch repair protein MutS [Ferruginibacter lapsinanis]UEG50320.1 DNA mismatch repair protein MutS [Ferruginibacter lapsinanis]
MEIDNTTLTDLSIMNVGEDMSIFSKLDFCKTVPGRGRMYENFNTPLQSIKEITSIQDTLKVIIKSEHLWPTQISNGSIMVVQKFYQATIDEIPSDPSALSVYGYKLFHGPDFHLVKYSVQHAFDFIKGMQLLVMHFLKDDTPSPLKNILMQAKELIDKQQFLIIEKNEKPAILTLGQQLHLAHFIRYNYKQNMLALLDMYFQLDAWYGMAMAVKQHGLVFPVFVPGDQPVVKATGLYHLLLEKPVSYDIVLSPESNFIFLTGANMAGKSTFIKSVGSAVFLAHIGMGVPAQQLELSLFDGLLSNINVVDNLIKGESYFYNEVQRIKATINKVTDKRKWLILIDELFKGTNVEDAMKCSSVVIEGLLKIKNSLFILSTHLYEIGEGLKKYPNINFNYFETAVTDSQLHFSYQLKKGISNDRLGYLILKKEGVVDMLDKLS